MPRMNLAKFSTPVLFLVASVAIYQVIKGVSESGPRPGKIPLSTLEAEFRSIPVPAGDVALGNIESFDKGSLSVVGRQLRSSHPMPDVFLHYDSVMAKRGWVLSSKNANAVEFCKGKVNLIIDTVSGQFHGVYYLGIAWTDDVNQPRYCDME